VLESKGVGVGRGGVLTKKGRAQKRGVVCARQRVAESERESEQEHDKPQGTHTLSFVCPSFTSNIIVLSKFRVMCERKIVRACVHDICGCMDG